MTNQSQPKAFISYSWSGSDHQEFVKECAERLLSDGVDVVLDIYDLKEGADKYAFMESMVTDKSVTHVLIMCDSRYSEKADARAAGVGTESQIISKHVYEKVDQSKFIPIICERREDGTAFTPTFLQSRISIDFSTPEKLNENWERLVRVLFGKPEHIKPTLGKRPNYIDASVPESVSSISSKFSSLKQAVIQEKKRIAPYRRDFLRACIEHADKIRVRDKSQVTGEEILEDLRNLKPVRNHLVDWILLESESNASEGFNESLIELLENLLELKSRPEEITQWSEGLFQAQSVFVYEAFIYVVAALLRNSAHETLREIFHTPYTPPKTERHSSKKFSSFDEFFGHSEALQILAPEGRQLHSPAAEYIKRNADRSEIPFEAIMEAELLILMMSFVRKVRWFPQTLYYAGFNNHFPLFQKASHKRYYKRLGIISDHQDPESLKSAINEGFQETNPRRWGNFHFINFLELLNVRNFASEQ